MSSEQVSIPVSSVFPYQSLIHHYSTLTHHRAISLRKCHIDISSLSRRLHLGVVFGSVQTQLYFSSRQQSTSFWTQQSFFNGISVSSLFPAQKSGVKKDPKTLQRGGPHTYRILNLLRDFVCFLLGNYSASGVYMPTFRNTLFHLHRQVNVSRMKWYVKSFGSKSHEPLGGSVTGQEGGSEYRNSCRGNDPHRGHRRVCEGGVRQGMVKVRLLRFRWLSPFFKLVQKGFPRFA